MRSCSHFDVKEYNILPLDEAQSYGSPKMAQPHRDRQWGWRSVLPQPPKMPGPPRRHSRCREALPEPAPALRGQQACPSSWALAVSCFPHMACDIRGIGVCICVCTCVCISVRPCIWMYCICVHTLHECACVYIRCLCTCVHMPLALCMCKCLYLCAHVRVLVCLWAHMPAHVCV